MIFKKNDYKPIRDYAGKKTGYYRDANGDIFTFEDGWLKMWLKAAWLAWCSLTDDVAEFFDDVRFAPRDYIYVFWSEVSAGTRLGWAWCAMICFVVGVIGFVGGAVFSR